MALSSEPRKVVIVGAGDHGRGTLDILKACNRERLQYDVVGFVDDDPVLRSTRVGTHDVLGSVEWLSNNYTADLDLILGIANCGVKKRLAARLDGARFMCAIHPSATLGSDVVICDGVIIGAGVVIAYSTAIGRHVTLNLNATVGHDCRVGDYSTIAPGANVAGRVTIGEGAEISLNATVVRGLTVGEWSVLGPGAVAIKDVPSSQTWFGNPARQMPRPSTVGDVERVQHRQSESPVESSLSTSR